MGQKCDVGEFDSGLIVAARRAGLSISESDDPLGCSCATVHYEQCQKQKCIQRVAVVLMEVARR